MRAKLGGGMVAKGSAGVAEVSHAVDLHVREELRECRSALVGVETSGAPTMRSGRNFLRGSFSVP